ncbi:YadA-like family protein [Pseudomonas alkylphenolica]|uniref:YadA-like family protein n=1 Tax=Pseudomonas alkylphenolica TaxID=237609 RepID=UPI0018D6DD2D|nr:YadA-like family protein [Pseudomonas alkylphenolica]MBH3429097.1 YadA-like family protein [Pseudomonas alkylphenolica]
MNRIYRLVWSRTQHCWCVASEYARKAGKGGRALAVLGLCAVSGLNAMDAEAAAGLYVNDSSDSACVFVNDTDVSGDMGWKYDGNNSNCDASDKAGQTGRVLFYGNGTQGSDSLTLGNELYVNGGRIGLNNRIDGSNSLAIGNVATDALGTQLGTRALAQDSVAIGNDALASEQNALALGSKAQAVTQDSVALGAGSVASTAGGVAGYIPGGADAQQANAVNATQSTLGAIAVGDAASGQFRQITGVAAGSQDSDAVNVAQLSSVGNTPMTFVGNSGAVDKKLGDTFVIQGAALSAGNYSGNNLRTEVDGNGSLQVQMADNLVLDSVTTGDTSVATNGLTIAGGPSVTNSGIDAGNQRVVNVAEGAINVGSLDAVNGSQLATTNQQLDQNTSQLNYFTTNISNGSIGPVQRTGTDQLSLIAAGGDAYSPGVVQTLTNVANGGVFQTSTDAINGSQLHTLANATTNALGGGSAVNPDGSISSPVYNLDGTSLNNVGDALINLDGRVIQNTSNIFALQQDALQWNGMLGAYDASHSTGDAQKISNVAAGEVSDLSTDAINGSQLHATNQQVQQNTTDISNVTTNINNISNGSLGPVQRTGTDQLSLIATGGDAASPGAAQVLNNVAAGAVSDTSTDAVNGSQLHATNQQVDATVTNVTQLDGRVTNVEGNVTTLQGDVTNLGDHVENIYNKGTKYFHANSTGTDSSATGADAVAIGMGATASHDGSVALGAGAVANGSTLGHQAYLVGGTASGEVNIGNRRLTGVSAGAEDTDGVNVAQLKAITSGAVADAVLYDNSSHDRITLGGTTYNSVTKSGGSKITNVARGEDDSDAVNLSQLNETNTRVTNIDGRVTAIDGTITTINNGGGIKYFHANSTRPDAVASGVDAVAVGPNAQASGSGAVAMGEGASASADGSVALGQGASDNGRGAQTYTGKYSNAANASVGTVSVGNAATGETRTVSNVADGKEATDAVNLRQLDGAVTESKQYTDDSIHNVNSEIANVTTNVSNLDNRVGQVEGDVSNVQNGTDGMFQVNNTSKQPKPRATGADAVAGGAGAQASAANSAAIGTRARASGRNATAVGSDAQAQADNSVALGANSVAERANSVSVGSAGNERQITHVAAGTAPTDAVNVKQLQQSMGDISNQFYDYTDARYNALRHDLKKQDDILSSGIAGAMAMATLPQPYSAGASMAAAGIGNYRGQSALAIGVSKISDNGKWVTKLQGSTTSQGDTGVAVGIGYQW